MQQRNSVLVWAFASALVSLTSIPSDARAQTAPSSDIRSLIVQSRLGLEAIDVSGQTSPDQTLTVTLVSTIDRDLPDVVLGRTSLQANASGAFTATISIAPGFTRGSIITVYVTSPGRRSAATARYLPDSPNHGVDIPLDTVPRDVR